MKDQPIRSMGKSELDESVDLSLCGLAPAQSQMDLFLDTLCARNKEPPILTNQKKPCHARLLLSCFFFRDMTTDFRGNGYSKNRLICDCSGEATHAIKTLLSNPLLLWAISELLFVSVSK